jgi:DNA polymerase elongation subunit (family B)
MGSKWNDFLIESYKDFGFTESPKPSVKYEFEGGLTGAFCGLYENVSKVDVESEYPHAMLLKLIASEKDSKKLILACLLYCLEYRLSLKKIAKQFKGEIKGTKADQRQGSEKIKINSSYGSFGTPNKEYNDYLAGACVTATGRALLKLIIRELIKRGAKIASYDTDGVFYTCGSFERNKEVWREINEILPGTGNIRFKLDYELEAKTFYVPPASGWVSDSEDEELEESKKAIFDREITGKKKNYIIIDNDGVMKCKGKFNKRDRSVLENTFTPKLVYEYHLGGIEASKKYYEETRKNLESRQYDPILLKVTRKIKDTEKRTVELGLGEHGDVVTIWKQKDLPKFGKKGQILKDTIVMWTDKPEHIDYNHYLDIIDEEYKEFISLLEGTKNHV